MAAGSVVIPEVAQAAGPRVVITAFDPPPWPRTRVVPINPETGFQIGCGLYLDSADNMLIRLVLSIESYWYKERGEQPPPQLQKDDLPATYRDQIWERYRSLTSSLTEFAAERRVFEENPTYLTRERAHVLVRASAPVLRKYNHAIPWHWERDDCSVQAG